VVDAFDDALGGVIKQIVMFTLRAPSGDLGGMQGVELAPPDAPATTELAPAP
jgi:hypothetical protein